MIKAPGRVGNVPVLLLGLQGENISRLMAGEPIVVDAHDPQIRATGYELPVLTVVIVTGKTDDEIKDRIIAEISKQATAAGPDAPPPRGPRDGGGGGG